jgi:endoglucanase
VTLMLHKLTKEDRYAADFNRWMDDWLKLPKTPKGLYFFLPWGPLRYASNAAFLAFVAADYGLKPDKYREFGMSQVRHHLEFPYIDV